MNDHFPNDAPVPVTPPNEATLVVHMAAQFENATQIKRGQAFLDNGERARLRRYDPEKPQLAISALVVRLLIEAGAEDAQTAPPRLARWTLLLHLLALLASTRETARLHLKGASFGAALFFADVSETRVLALLGARGDIFDALLARTVRRLAAAGRTEIDTVRLWYLMQSHGGASDKDRLAVAHDFFSQQAKSAKQSAA